MHTNEGFGMLLCTDTKAEPDEEIEIITKNGLLDQSSLMEMSHCGRR